MHAKKDGRPVPARTTATDIDLKQEKKSPAKGLSAALETALGSAGARPQFPVGKGALHRPDQINRAPKPIGGASRAAGPRRGHR